MLRTAAAVVLLSVLLACPTGHGVVLTWISGGGYTPAVVYRVYRQQDGGGTTVAAVVEQMTAPTWTDSNISSGHKYAYWVTAYDQAALAESKPSNTWAVTIP